METIFRELSYVTIYLDDILIHSVNEDTNKVHLTEIFNRLSDAGVILRGKKCKISMISVTNLGPVFSANEMTPDPSKIFAVQRWPTPTSVTTVRQFLGLASYYYFDMHHFSHIVAPLHALTQKNTVFCWNESCQKVFTTLKERLVQPSVLWYLQFHSSASQFAVYIDASDVGLGVVLEQDNHVIVMQALS